MGIIELSEKMGFHKSTVSRFLHVMSKKGFLHQNPDTKKFQLGPSAMTLGVAIKKSLETNLVHIAKPYIDSLREELHETILEISQKLYLKPPLPGGPWARTLIIRRKLLVEKSIYVKSEQK